MQETIMTVPLQEVRANRDYFFHKLHAEKSERRRAEGGRRRQIRFRAPGHARPRAVCQWTYTRGLVRAGRRDRQVDSVITHRQRTGHIVLGSRLTAVRESSSAVGRAWLLLQGNECWLERMDVQPAPTHQGQASIENVHCECSR